MTWHWVSVSQYLAIAVLGSSSSPAMERAMQLSTNTRPMCVLARHSASLKRVFCRSNSGLPDPLGSLACRAGAREAADDEHETDVRLRAAFGELEARVLQVEQRLAERLAFLRVARGEGDRLLRRGHRAQGDLQPPRGRLL